ncbi:aminotransferase [Corynebacterium maris DSM 45190]|uniref:Aminotransferase n=1 Tax=Corynebacterium maris DSM 45190 TaxID=1224163 RepID=S5TFL2_9CORY|nr:aminotransferase class V-fold PLP-dependent enzyme [Corynebacterium maris]AGS33721.1 aminotransferase [Corynebacterium maris DSM 45190]
MGSQTRYDVANVRGLYTSLSDGWTYLNAHDRPQIPERVSAAVARAFRTSTAMTRPGSTHQQEPCVPVAPGIIADARAAVAELVGGDPDAVVLGPSLQVLYQGLVTAMRPQLRYQSNLVLSHFDAEALTVPFNAAGVADIRWAQADLGTGALPAWQYRELVDGSTRLVSVPAAQPLLGAVVDVAEVVEEVRARSRAWVLVDASAYAPYRLVDIEEWNADIIAVDFAQLGGPQLAALIFRDPRMFKRLDSLDPAYSRADGVAAKLETPVSVGLAGGVAATVEHLARFVDLPADEVTDATTGRDRLAHSMGQLAGYMDGLCDRLYQQLGSLPQVHIFGASGEVAQDSGDEVERLPRLSFAVRGVPAATVQRRLLDNALITGIAPDITLLREMGTEETGGAVTVALGPFTTTGDLDHLVRVVASLA